MITEFLTWVKKSPTKVAVNCAGTEYTYEELWQRIQSRLASLAKKAPEMRSIAVFADNSIDFVELLLSVPASGRLLTIINSRADLETLKYIINRVKPEILYLDESRMSRFGAEIAALVPPVNITNELNATVVESASVTLADDFAAWLIHTSGTTANPKGVLLSSGAIKESAKIFVQQLDLNEESRVLMPFSLSHVTANTVPAVLSAGACLYLQEKFDAVSYLEAIEKYRITFASIAPAMIHLLLEQPLAKTIDHSSLKTIYYGSSPISENLLRETMEVFAGVGLAQAYGLTETCGAALLLDAESHALSLSSKPQLQRSAGKPIAGVEAKIVAADGSPLAAGESGELLIKGPNILLGYYDDQRANDEALADGWFHTGDVAVKDDEGYFYIVDRLKDMIVSGGENVASLEVERVLLQHPKVEHAAVFGMPDDRWGEAVTAAVVVADRADSGEITETELIDYARANLAGYKVPRRIHFVAQMPRNSMGKIVKGDLKKVLS